MSRTRPNLPGGKSLGLVDTGVSAGRMTDRECGNTTIENREIRETRGCNDADFGKAMGFPGKRIVSPAGMGVFCRST
jgi:hypothetical protein